MSPSAVVLIVIAGVSAVLSYVVWGVLPRRLAANMDSSVFTFSKAIELRCEPLSLVNERIVNLCVLTGRQLGLSLKQLRDLEHAARLRNIGLVTVPWKTMNGPYDLAQSAEFSEEFARHPKVGASMLKLVPTLRHLSLIVECHKDPRSTECAPIQSHIIYAVTHYVEGVQLIEHAEMVDQLLVRAGTDFEAPVVEALLSVLPSESAVVSSSEVVSR